jgi:toxin YoeB
MMQIVFEATAWEDYLYWVETDKSILKRINTLINACARNPYEGLGKPEGLKGNYKGFWSRRINDTHRLVYGVKDNRLHILQCRWHYSK